MAEHYTPRQLIKAMKKAFSRVEVRELCIYLKEDERLTQLDDENWQGKDEAIIEMVEYCRKRDALPILASMIEEAFPYVLIDIGSAEKATITSESTLETQAGTFPPAAIPTAIAEEGGSTISSEEIALVSPKDEIFLRICDRMVNCEHGKFDTALSDGKIYFRFLPFGSGTDQCFSTFAINAADEAHLRALRHYFKLERTQTGKYKGSYSAEARMLQ